MFEMSEQLAAEIGRLVENEPTTADYTSCKVKLGDDDEVTILPQLEVRNIEKSNDKIIASKTEEMMRSILGLDPDEEITAKHRLEIMEVTSKPDWEERYNKWFAEEVEPMLEQIEVIDIDFRQEEFMKAADEFYADTLKVRDSFKKELLEHYGLEDNEDTDMWFEAAGGPGIPTKDIEIVIKAFDEIQADPESAFDF